MKYGAPEQKSKERETSIKIKKSGKKDVLGVK